jgi:hypothetical protein
MARAVAWAISFGWLMCLTILVGRSNNVACARGSIAVQYINTVISARQSSCCRLFFFASNSIVDILPIDMHIILAGQFGLVHGAISNIDHILYRLYDATKETHTDTGIADEIVAFVSVGLA